MSSQIVPSLTSPGPVTRADGGHVVTDRAVLEDMTAGETSEKAKHVLEQLNKKKKATTERRSKVRQMMLEKMKNNRKNSDDSKLSKAVLEQQQPTDDKRVNRITEVCAFSPFSVPPPTLLPPNIPPPNMAPLQPPPTITIPPPPVGASRQSSTSLSHGNMSDVHQMNTFLHSSGTSPEGVKKLPNAPSSDSIPSFFKSHPPPSPLLPILGQYSTTSPTPRTTLSHEESIMAVQRLCAVKVTLQHKRAGLERLLKFGNFTSQLVIQMLTDEGGNIIDGALRMIDCYRVMPDNEQSYPLLLLTLEVLNKCLGLGSSNTSVRSLIYGLTRKLGSDRSSNSSHSFLQQLLRMCDPRGGVFTDKYTDQLCGELQELPCGHILGELQMSADRPETIIEMFQQCLGVSLGAAVSPIVKQLPEQYRVVGLSLVNLSGSGEVNLAKLMQEQDPDQVWAVKHPTKSRGARGVGVQEWAEMHIARMFPSGHFLAYTDQWATVEDELDKIETELESSVATGVITEVFPGLMVTVRAGAMEEVRGRPRRKFHLARAVVTDSCGDAVDVYLIDHGVTGKVKIKSLSPPPKEFNKIPPRLTFCRLQGVGPAPDTGLLRQSILAIARLVTNVSAFSLVCRTQLESGRILSQLLGCGERDIQQAALNTLSVVTTTPAANKILVRAMGEAPPPAVEMICPAVVYLLENNRGTLPVRDIKTSLEILNNLLDTLRPDHMKAVYDSTGIVQLLEDLKGREDVTLTHGGLIETMIAMPKKGNHHVPDIPTNSIKRREASRQKEKDKIRTRPAAGTRDMAAVIGGHKKEEVETKIFRNTDIRLRDDKARPDNGGRVSPVAEYNPHRVVSATGGPVWANVDQLQHPVDRIMNDTTALATTEEGEGSSENDENVKSLEEFGSGTESGTEQGGGPTKMAVNVINADRCQSLGPEVTEPAKPVKASSEPPALRPTKPAAAAEATIPTVTRGHILNEKHGPAVELWATDRRDICRSQLAAVVCGMLNSPAGGTVYIGVRQNGWIQGVPLTRQDRDLFRQQVDRILASMINPRVPPNIVNIDFVRAEDRSKPATEFWIIRVKVRGSGGDVGRVYMAHNLLAGVREGMYLRVNTGPNYNRRMNPDEIVEELKKIKLGEMKKMEKEMSRLNTGQIYNQGT